MKCLGKILVCVACACRGLIGLVSWGPLENHSYPCPSVVGAPSTCPQLSSASLHFSDPAL